MADPEVPERPVRRHFSAEYKLRIVEEANAAAAPGEVGAPVGLHGVTVHWRGTFQGGDVVLVEATSPAYNMAALRERERREALLGVIERTMCVSMGRRCRLARIPQY